MQLFAENGFARTTVEEIARRAGIAKGTIYLYYASKDEIYRAAFARNVVELRQRTEAAMEAAQTTGEKVREFIATKLRYFEEHRGFFTVYFSEAHPHLGHSPALQRELAASARSQLHALAAELRRAMAEGKVRTIDAESAAVAIFELTRSAVRRRMQASAGGVPVDDDVAFFFDFIWRGLGVS